MAFKSLDEILKPDPRFADRVVIENGVVHRLDLESHHAMIATIRLSEHVPDDVHAVFDRARNTVVYAFFDYDLLAVGEMQACGAFELALKYRVNGHGGATRRALGQLVDRARKAGFLPSKVPDTVTWCDPIQALIKIRNGLSHGTKDIHSPDLAFPVIEACAYWTNHLFQPN